MSRLIAIQGPPGCGKTTWLSDQIANAATKYRPEAIVTASMTRTGAREIAMAADRAGTQLPDENVGTLHRHAHIALDRPKLADTGDLAKTWDADHPDTPVGGGSTATGDLDEQVDASPAGGTHAEVQVLRARGIPIDQWPPYCQAHHTEWEDFKRQHDAVDFTDLIELARTDTDMHPAAPAVLALDEAQDFSHLELQLALHWSKGVDTTLVVGDVDQTLFEWRGADPDAFQAIPATEHRVLSQSYRVPAAVHQAATQWIGQIPGRTPVEYKPRVDEHGQVVDGLVRNAPWRLGHPALIADIEVQLAAGRTVMVLATTRRLIAPAVAALKQAGIPFGNPYRVKEGGWNPMRAAQRLNAFLAAQEPTPDIWTWRQLKQWTEPIASGALGKGAKTLIAHKCGKSRFGETEADNPVSLKELEDVFGIRDYGMMRHPAIQGDVTWWADNLLSSQAAKYRFAVEVHRRHGPAALRAEPRVTVGTVHSVKGGQADVVYLAPDLSRQGFWQGWNVEGNPRDAVVRCMYVGMTRAREELVLLAPGSGEAVPLGGLA